MGKLSSVFNLNADPASTPEIKANATMDKPAHVLEEARQTLHGLGTQRLLDGCEVTEKADKTGFNVVVPREDGQTNKAWAAAAGRVASELSYRLADIGNTTHKGGRIYCTVPEGSMTKQAFVDLCNGDGAEKIDFKGAMADVLGVDGLRSGAYKSARLADPTDLPMHEVLGEMNMEPDISFDHVPDWATDVAKSMFKRHEVEDILSDSAVTKMVDGTGYNVVVGREEDESNKQWAARSKEVAEELDGWGLHIKNSTHKGGRIYCELHESNDPEIQDELDDVKAALENVCLRTKVIESFEDYAEKASKFLSVGAGAYGSSIACPGDATEALRMSAMRVRDRLDDPGDLPVPEFC